MSEKKKIILAALIIIFLMGVFPPIESSHVDLFFTTNNSAWPPEYYREGYDFLFALEFYEKINLPLLFVQWVLVFCLAAGLIIIREKR